MQALLVVDVQNDFCPGGKLAVPDGDAVVPVINSLTDGFDHVFLTQDWHPPGHSSFASSYLEKDPYETVELTYGEQILWPDHCIQGSKGAEFHPELDIDRGEVIIRKGFRKGIDSYSAFFENDHRTPTGLTGYLRERGIDELYIVGLATDFCVHWSAVDGREQGFDVYVVRDATRAIDVNGSLDHAMRRMHEVNARLVTADEVRSSVAA